jgi:hypothetical protein
MLSTRAAIEYLQAGSPVQRAVYLVLQRHAVLHKLQAYSLCLVGTFPLDIAVASSDVDIICEVHDFGQFCRLVGQHFSQCPAYAARQLYLSGIPSLVISFYLDEFEIEIFGQPLPPTQQAGYRHLAVEARLLAVGGPMLREKVIQLKTNGIKTEAAFATLLSLPGDPYQAVLDLEACSDQELLHLIRQGA